MITSSFLIVYVIAASFQVACLLVLAYTLTHFLWKKGTTSLYTCLFACLLILPFSPKRHKS